MLSAITASTGGGGTCTRPSVAAVSVRLWETVKAVTVFKSVQWRASSDKRNALLPASRPGLLLPKQIMISANEQEVIYAGQNVLDTEDGERAGYLQPARRGFDDEGRGGRGEAGDLGRAVETFQTHKHVGHCRGETGDMNGAAGQSARPL